jgi:AraC-like DNA-binding protein
MAVSKFRNRRTQNPLLVKESVPLDGSVRISVVWHLPEVLRGLGLDPAEALEAAGLRADMFGDRENRIDYTDFANLLLACEELSNCDHIALLISQHSRLADFGLAGRAALCRRTAGEGLQSFVDHFSLHSSASTATLIASGNYARFVYAISVQGMTDTRPFHLGAMALAFNILRELFGRGWHPVVVTFASRAPTNPRPAQLFFHAPLRFDSEESAVVFDRQWLHKPLPPVDPLLQRQVEQQVLAQRAKILADFPATIRRILRKQLLIGECSMDFVAALIGMHRRTLDRHLERQGLSYGELLESVKADVARQLLRDTDMKVQNVAESLHYSSAANFSTAFKRWSGITPGEYRRRAR